MIPWPKGDLLALVLTRGLADPLAWGIPWSGGVINTREQSLLLHSKYYRARAHGAKPAFGLVERNKNVNVSHFQIKSFHYKSILWSWLKLLHLHQLLATGAKLYEMISHKGS